MSDFYALDNLLVNIKFSKAGKTSDDIRLEFVNLSLQHIKQYLTSLSTAGYTIDDEILNGYKPLLLDYFVSMVFAKSSISEADTVLLNRLLERSWSVDEHALHCARPNTPEGMSAFELARMRFAEYIKKLNNCCILVEHKVVQEANNAIGAVGQLFDLDDIADEKNSIKHNENNKRVDTSRSNEANDRFIEEANLFK
jgi:hypothetical protein